MPERQEIEHSTYKGYQQHRYRGEDPCDACRDANTAYHRTWRHAQTAEQKRRPAERAAARRRALELLAQKYPSQFKKLLAAELASKEQ